MNGNYLFTSESVSEGHPDKLCDQISDAVLDACIKDDINSRVACECYTTNGMIVVGGEITTNAIIDVKDIARQVVKEIGYTNADYGLDYKSMAVLDVTQRQSQDISQGVDRHGAGDQGMMFGYATNETPDLMPAPIMIAHKIINLLTFLRKNGGVNDISYGVDWREWMRPDAKCQVTMRYEHDKPVEIDTIIISQQHSPEILTPDNHIIIAIKDLIKDMPFYSDNTKFLVNPTGRFVIGGPAADTGLTGRKIIVDTYGGMGRHGGGAFSGKDPTKVDRSAAYMARHIAKKVVHRGFAERCEVQLSYAIGIAEPVSIYVDSFGTGQNDQIIDYINSNFDLTPVGIINRLNLLNPIYQQTAAGGHFGRNIFPWEKVN